MKIDILTKPYEKPDAVKRAIQKALLETNIHAVINHTSNFSSFNHLSIDPARTPIIIINGNVEFAGRVPEIAILRNKLKEVAFRV